MPTTGSDPRAPSADDLSRNLTWLRSLALELVGDPHLAEDLTQEAALIALARGRWERSWLAGVLRNLRKSSHRSQGRRRHHEQTAARSEAVAPAMESLERAGVLRDVMDALLALDEPYRGTLLLRYVDGLRPREIAARLGVPAPTVASRLTRGLARLREELDRRHPQREQWTSALLVVATGELTQRAIPVGAWIMAASGKLAVTASVLVLAWVGWQATQGTGEPDAAGSEPGARASLTAQAAAPARAELELASTPGRTPAPAVVAKPQTIALDIRVLKGAYPPLGLEEGPAEGVPLTIVPGERRAFGPAPPETVSGTTDADGRFTAEFSNRGSRPFTATIVAGITPGYRWQERVVRIDGDTPAGREVLLVLPAFGQVPGRVENELGEPLAGVLVTARPNMAGSAPEHATSTDSEGRFRVSATVPSALSATAAGWALTHSPRLEMVESGGWEPVELVMVPAGSLLVRAREPDGTPVPDLEFKLKVAEVELPATVGFRFDPQPRLEAVSGEAGLAELSGCWIGRKLVLSMTDHGKVFRFDGHEGGELTLSGTPGSRPLVVPLSGMLELDLVREPPLVVRGVVRFPDGGHPSKGRVKIRDVGRKGSAARQVDEVSASCDENGAFEALLTRRGLVGPVAVTAFDSAPGRGLARVPSVAGHGARIDVDPDAAVDGVLELELVLEPTFSIAGTLLEEDGSPIATEGFGNRVYAVPAGAPSRFSPTALGLEATATSRDGSFRIGGLPAGQYDLFGTRELNNFFSHSTAIHRFTGIPAGTEGLELRLPKADEVRVRIRLSPEGSQAESAVVLLSNLQPWDAREAPAASPSRLDAHSPANWPASAPINFTGASGGDGDGGRYQHGLYGVKGVDGHELPTLGPGWYRFGVNAFRADASAPLPVATELVYLHPGEYELHVRLSPTARVQGRLVAPGMVAHLAVALETADGVAIPQPSHDGGRLVTTTPVTAAGGFELRGVPLGRTLMRVGSPEQLEVGEFEHERWFEVAEGENAPLEVLIP